MMRVWIGLLVVSVSTPLLAQTTYRVNLDGSADFVDIQSALDAAADGDIVLVAPGEYVITEPIDFNRFHNPDDPPVKNLVLRSEAGAEATIIRMGDEPEDPDEASVVVFLKGESSASVLEGFTLTGGRSWHGGGLECSSSSPTVRNCLITGNEGFSGGGVGCHLASPTLIDCLITENEAEWGGGLASYLASPLCRNCTIASNRAFAEQECFPTCDGIDPHAGGSAVLITFLEDAPVFTNCIVWGSVAGEDPAGSDVTFAYSCVKGEVWPGEGNINEDPLFCDPENGDYRLRQGSPCIGTAQDGGNMGADLGTCQDTGRIPGDCNTDGKLDLSDAVCVFGVLFTGNPPSFPCGDGLPAHPGNINLIDWQPDGRIDLSDGVGILLFLFRGGQPHPVSDPIEPRTTLVQIPDCP